jgi:plastocyanin
MIRLVCACTAALWLALPSRPVTRVVEMKGMQFVPARMTAHPGDTIVWHNADIVPHTATSGKTFDTGELIRGERGKFVVKRRGVIEYLCTYHTTMRGVITVR